MVIQRPLVMFKFRLEHLMLLYSASFGGEVALKVFGFLNILPVRARRFISERNVGKVFVLSDRLVIVQIMLRVLRPYRVD